MEARYLKYALATFKNIFLFLAKKKKGDDKSDGDVDSESSQRSETEEILDSILPPREWEESGQLWRQSVSSTPATRLDVINLQVGLQTINPLINRLIGNDLFTK